VPIISQPTQNWSAQTKADHDTNMTEYEVKVTVNHEEIFGVEIEDADVLENSEEAAEEHGKFVVREEIKDGLIDESTFEIEAEVVEEYDD